ncbi:hypothetical protein QBC39DRAFT_396383 [Podospora conica]|nr:hypothetical protein QBC39DRAFT_396383 [Schizothecium conicum]
MKPESLLALAIALFAAILTASPIPKPPAQTQSAPTAEAATTASLLTRPALLPSRQTDVVDTTRFQITSLAAAASGPTDPAAVARLVTKSGFSGIPGAANPRYLGAASGVSFTRVVFAALPWQVPLPLPAYYEARVDNHVPELDLAREPLNGLHQVLVALAVAGALRVNITRRGDLAKKKTEIGEVPEIAGVDIDLVREMRVVRLGQGVDRARRIADASLERVFGAVEEYIAVVEQYDHRERTGVEPEVLDGDAEAAISFAGATRALPPLGEPILVLDIGGVPDNALDRCSVDPADAGAAIDIAGTVTTLAAGVLDLSTYDSTVIYYSVLYPDAVQGPVSRLLSISVEQRKALPYLPSPPRSASLDTPRKSLVLRDRLAVLGLSGHGLWRDIDVHLTRLVFFGRLDPGRADVIGAGGLILDRVLRRTSVGSMLVSEHDILDGIAWSLTEYDAAGDQGRA